MAWILDLDGVVWLSEAPIPGSAGAVARLRDAGHRVLFLTNNSDPEVGVLVDKLNGMGVPAEASDIVTSAQAAASLVEPGSTALVCAGKGVEEALKERGAHTVEAGAPGADDAADAVVVGFHRHFNYERLTSAFSAVHRGARLIGTNDDPTYPTPDGPVPGGGSLLAAVATAAGVTPEVAGKPNEAMGSVLRARLGDDTDGAVLVGDRPSTDGLMARRLGLPFALVLSGVTADAPTGDEAADMVAPDLVTLVDRELDA